MNKILIISAPPPIQLLIRDILPRCVHYGAASYIEAYQVFDQHRPDIVIIYTEEMDSSFEKLLRSFREKTYSTVPVIIITNPIPLHFALEFSGLDDVHYVPLPLDENKLKHIILRAAAGSAEVHESHPVLHSLTSKLIGESAKIQEVKHLICTFAVTDEPILITGETGTGKEITAHMIHELSRKDFTFRCINCSTLSHNLMESELFGHARGAFTGAEKAHTGYFQTCNGGTLFLDEIGDLPLSLQPKLLRVIESKTINPVGDTHPVHVDTRVITATNRNLEDLMNQGLFRSDLYHRIRTLQIQIPPLRERTEDIPLLVSHLLRRNPRVHISDPGMEELKHYHWPGNVRELYTALTRTVLLFCSDRNMKYRISGKQVRKILNSFC